MRSTFFGLEIAKRALMAQRWGMDVTSHNVANANTEGYSRQEIRLAATRPYCAPTMNRLGARGQVGTGVEVKAVVRASDAFVESQIRNTTSALEQWETSSSVLHQVEDVFMEPTDQGLASFLDAFWASWQELCKHPQELAARTGVIESAENLAFVLRETRAKLAVIDRDVGTDLLAGVEQVNYLADGIALLNGEIARVESSGDSANDLRDKRDMLMRELSGYVAPTFVEQKDGAVDVLLDGRGLVLGKDARHLWARPEGGVWAKVIWEDTGADARLKGGTLAALEDIHSSGIPGYAAQLDTVASTLIQQVNAIHRTAYGLDGLTGRDFFTGTDSATIQVASDVASDPSKVGASASPAPGDGSMALAVAQLKGAKILGGGTASIGDYYADLVARLGTDVRSAGRAESVQKAVLDQQELRKTSVAGVSVDEEMMNMVRFQTAYDAAARLVTSIDEMLRTLLQMGVTG